MKGFLELLKYPSISHNIFFLIFFVIITITLVMIYNLIRKERVEIIVFLLITTLISAPLATIIGAQILTAKEKTIQATVELTESLYTTPFYNLEKLDSGIKKLTTDNAYYKLSPNSVYNSIERHLKYSSPKTKFELLSKSANLDKIHLTYEVSVDDKKVKFLAIYTIRNNKIDNFEEYILKESINYN